MIWEKEVWVYPCSMSDMVVGAFGQRKIVWLGRELYGCSSMDKQIGLI